jgi:hypothetical protein
VGGRCEANAESSREKGTSPFNMIPLERWVLGLIVDHVEHNAMQKLSTLSTIFQAPSVLECGIWRKVR